MKNIYDMYDFFDSLSDIEDPRQFKKVKYPINEVVGMVLIASLGNANEWTEIEAFCKLHEALLKKYFKLENGIPSHDTFQRVMGMIEPNTIQQLQIMWNEYVSQNDGEDIKKYLISLLLHKNIFKKSIVNLRQHYLRIFSCNGHIFSANINFNGLFSLIW